MLRRLNEENIRHYVSLLFALCLAVLWIYELLMLFHAFGGLPEPVLVGGLVIGIFIHNSIGYEGYMEALFVAAWSFRFCLVYDVCLKDIQVLAI